jgi:HKD family nuclease
MNIEAITVQIAKLELKSGDTLVVSIDDFLNNDRAQMIKDHLEPMLPKGVKAMVLGRGMTVTKLTTPEGA